MWVFCANFVPLAYKIRPHLGICGNSEELSSYWYYYPCLLQYVPVYPLWKTSNLNVGSSSLSACTSHTNGLRKSNSLQITNLCQFCAPDLERTLGFNVRSYWPEHKSGNWWSAIRWLGWHAGDGWTLGVRGGEAQHTDPPGRSLVPPHKILKVVRRIYA